MLEGFGPGRRRRRYRPRQYGSESDAKVLDGRRFVINDLEPLERASRVPDDGGERLDAEGRVLNGEALEGICWDCPVAGFGDKFDEC